MFIIVLMQRELQRNQLDCLYILCVCFYISALLQIKKKAARRKLHSSQKLKTEKEKIL